MKLPEPSCDLEQTFAMRAAALPLAEAEVSRTEHGLLRLFWKSPCDEIGGLSLYVNGHEIMLSTKAFHTHHDEVDYSRENLPSSEVHVRIVDSAIAEALAIMKGEKVFSTTYDTKGNATSQGMGPLIQSDEAKEHERQFQAQFPDMFARQRTWTWFGELTEQ
jgi:hypothetical protein